MLQAIAPLQRQLNDLKDDKTRLEGQLSQQEEEVKRLTQALKKAVAAHKQTLQDVEAAHKQALEDAAAAQRHEFQVSSSAALPSAVPCL